MPRPPTVAALGLALAAAATSACTQQLVLPEPGGGSGSGGFVGSGGGGVGGRGSGVPDGGSSCSQPNPVQFRRRTAGLILIVGRNLSMATAFGNGNRMTVTQEILSAVVRERPSAVRFGYQEFPSNEPSCAFAGGCCAGTQAGPATNNDLVINKIGDCPPGMSDECVFGSDARPLAVVLGRARDLYRPLNPDQITIRNVLLIVDGPPGCPYENPADSCSSAVEAVNGLGFDMINTYVVGIGDGASNDRCLEDLAASSGRELKRARTPSELQQAVTSTVDRVSADTCRIDLIPPFDSSTLTVYLDDVPVPRADPGRQRGWSVTEGPRPRIELHGSSCTALLEANEGALAIGSCPNDDF